MNLETQTIELDVFNEDVEKTSKKRFIAENRDNFLSKWIFRPPARVQFPPFGAAIGIKADNKDRRDRIAKGFIASLMCAGNDFQHQNLVYFLSGPSVSAGALSVIPENFEQAMVVHTARHITKATWLNDRDQFMKPNRELDKTFIVDCAVWSFFSISNQTAALKDVEYEGQVYQIHNHFFPFPVDEVKTWDIPDADIRATLLSATDTYVAQWLAAATICSKGTEGDKRSATPVALSPEAKSVLDKAREIYRFYFSNLSRLRLPKYKIETWDAGWWQIKQALKDVSLGDTELSELKKRHDVLKEKLLPQLRVYGIIG